MALSSKRPLSLILAVLCPTIFGLQSTGVRNKTFQDTEGPYFLQRVDHYSIVHFPGCGNRDCNATGVAIGFDNHVVTEKSINQIDFAEGDLQGRAAIIRFKRKGFYDIAVCSHYSFLQRNATDKERIQRLNGWVCEKFARLPKRCLPILLSDANGRLGINSSTLCGSPCTGIWGGIKENWAGTQYRNMLQSLELAAINTLRPSMCGPTWFSKQYATRPDYVAVPPRFLVNVVSAYVDYQSAFILQLANTTYLFDHAPLVFRFSYVDWHFDPAWNIIARGRWSRSVVEAFAANPSAKEQFVCQLEKSTQQQEVQDAFEVWSRFGFVDQCWELLNSLIDNAATNCTDFRSCVAPWVFPDAAAIWRKFTTYRN